MVFPLRSLTETSAPCCAGKAAVKTGVALQIGPLDQTQDLGIVDLCVIVLFDRAAHEHGGDAEGNTHLGLQGISVGPWESQPG